ncbi:type II secretion system F family protein [Rhizobium sp. CSW-27]|uniref:type II secretion system F family protein n=1 Tax=Rhizobium sp. CSW-27 TaxID=2839985 RepID=UPI001C02E457|nr:type II secretion system F family protein [Rhizobium sp. CSW-27]MBT9371443.1 type II secretion system F family protein [Rhizobium sp. CSW-27]
MFGLDLTALALAGLVALSAGGLAYVFLFSRLEVERKTASRVTRVKAAETDRGKVKAARDRVQEISRRRKSLQESLKALESKQLEQSRKIGDRSIKAKLSRSGLPLSPSRFHLLSAGLGLLVCLIGLLAGLPLPVVAGAGFVAGLGVPRWGLGVVIRRRQEKFLEELPNALDLITRSIRSGLPLNDAMRLIASEGQEPVRSEFRRVVESQQVGISLPDACARMILTMPLPEVNFFAIVIAIQAQAGGNLSEALGNLARVLRERRRMKAKVQALSMEAKASAAIIGALPFIVALLVYLTSPHYLAVLFTDPRGHMILLFSGVWMSIGIFVMRNMINFEI